MGCKKIYIHDTHEIKSNPIDSDQIVFHAINVHPLRIAVGVIIIIGGIVLFPVKVS